MPESHQDEINEMIRLFDKNKIRIEKQFHKEKNSKRTMIFYRWYGNKLNKSINDFNKDFKYIKTIGVSLFREKTRTSKHFGPLRLSYRVLYNFNKVKNPGSFIEVDEVKNLWKDNPLFIFDDTLIHQSINEEEDLRYCAFIDILRPTYSFLTLNFLMYCVNFFMKYSKGIFYKNWKVL